MSDERTPVIFRRWRGKDGDIIALFPTIPCDYHGGTCSSYEHIGQHGAADYGLVMRRTVPARRFESLEIELIEMGYNLLVCKRRTPAMRDEYTKNLRSFK